MHNFISKTVAYEKIMEDFKFSFESNFNVVQI